MRFKIEVSFKVERICLTTAFGPSGPQFAPFANLSEYSDPVANPAVRSWRYKISAVDSCDIEMMRQLGFCSGIENYSRHLDGREQGSAPNCLLDYFPEDFLVVIDESHVTVPQIGAMHEGDAARKRTLVEHGFRLPSAMDNRPLKFAEFLERCGQKVYLSATPGKYELEKTKNDVVEQVIRPTGLVDPKIVVKPIKGQIDDLINEIRLRADRNERVLVTTLTKSSRFLEYMKLHLISLEQDLEKNPESINVIDIPGQIEATRHLLSVATDIMNSSNERYINE